MFTKRKRHNKFICLLESKKKSVLALTWGWGLGSLDGLTKEGMIALPLNLRVVTLSGKGEKLCFRQKEVQLPKPGDGGK